MGLAVAWYRARAELRARWPAIAVLALLIGLVGGVSLAAVAGARRTTSSYDRFREETRASDAFVTSDVLEPAVLEAALDQPRVRSYSQVPLFIGIPGGPSDFAVYASPDGGFGTTLDRPRVLEGHLPDPAAPHEVAINEATAEQLDIGVGDTVVLETFSVEQWENLGDGFFGDLEGPALELEVVGLVRAPEDLSGVPTIGGLGTPAFVRRYEDRVGAFDALFAVDLVEGSADGAAFEDELERRLPTDREWGVQTADDNAAPVRDALGVISSGLALFAGCAGVAGTVAVGQALGRHLSSNGDDRAALAAIGVRRTTRALAAFVPTGVAAVAGAALAVAVAVAASPVFPMGLGRRAEPDLGIDIDVATLAIGFGGVAFVAGVWSLAAAWSVSGRGAEARPAPRRPSLLTSWLTRWNAGPRLVTGARMALEPGRGRTSVPVRAALAGAVLGIAGLVAAVTFGSSLDRLVATPSRWGWSFDLAPELEDAESDAERFVAEPGAGAVGVLEVAFVRVEGEGVQAHALTPVKGAPTMAMADGRGPAGPGEIVLGRSLLERLGKDVGDTVALEGAVASGEPIAYVVVGTATFPTFDDFGAGFAEGALLSPEGLEPVRQEEGFRRVVVELSDGASEEDRQRLLERYRENLSIYALPRPPGEVANLGQVDALPWVLGAFLLALALAAVAHTLVVTVRRRGRDLAVLRSIGFVRADVRGVVAWQASVLAGCGVLVGLPLGVAGGRLAWATVAQGIGVLDDPAVPVAALILLPFAALLVANLLGVLPARAAARIRPALVLRAE